MIRLSDCIAVRRRYVRSVNLERDLDLAGSLDGYAVTPRAAGLLNRIAAAERSRGTARAWTVTGVYGSGKSAFAHLLAALHGPKDNPLRQQAIALLRQEEGTKSLAAHFQTHVPAEGLVRAIVSGRREPVGHTILRALASGAEAFWSRKRGVRPRVVEQLCVMHELASGGNSIDTSTLVEMTVELAKASRSGLVMILDELGKVLEDAGRSAGARDLFLLQQLAELSASDGEPIVVVGLLHQAFSDYGSALGTIERGEWEKVQGRFEDVPFTGPAEEMLYLMGRAIERNTPAALNEAIAEDARRWHQYFARSLTHPYVSRTLEPALIDAIYPLHPIAALVLPSLCGRYAQNDRSLFTFLTSNEPHSLGHFLSEVVATVDRRPVLRIDQIYDYFVNVVTGGLSSRPQFQRWAEIHGVVHDARGLSPDETLALKVIATFNLLSSTGPLRASRGLVTAALLESPSAEGPRWGHVLDRLVAQRLITYRSQVDEYRVWEGSDFDVEGETRTHLAAERRSLADALTEVAALPPLVAQRHSYRTGTLRYFERQFVDSDERLRSLRCSASATDGMIAYWVTETRPTVIPDQTSDGKPLVVAQVAEPEAIRSAVLELAALRAVERGSLALQTDGVARREVRMRLRLAQDVLDGALRSALAPERLPKLWMAGQKVTPAGFRAALSGLCDRAYAKTPKLWNELINRRELTSQGARARRELIEALIQRPEQERLGLVGEGPAYSMYASLLLKTGIHRRDGETWHLQAPRDSGIRDLWQAVEGFCLQAGDAPRSIDQLYTLLEAPPYGVKRGIVPVFLAAVLMLHEEDLSVYQGGTFIPVLGPEHFELLVRQPSLFAVKHFALTGLRREFFRDLEAMVSGVRSIRTDRSRNATLLSVVRPLVRFATSLQKVTLKTEQIGEVARAVRAALLTASEPDRLLFENLPKACGHRPFRSNDSPKRADYHAFRQTLRAALRDLSLHYESLLERCGRQIHSAFGIRSELAGLREDLRVRAQYLVGQCLEPRLRSFILAAARAEGSDREWLETLAMIIGDRPPETWSDDDVLAFEANASNLARRFANLEALQKEAARSHEPGFEARRVTITRPDGVEFSDLIWVDADQNELLEPHIKLLLEKITAVNPEHQRHAIAVGVLERLLGQRAVETEPTVARKPAKVTHG